MNFVDRFVDFLFTSVGMIGSVPVEDRYPAMNRSVLVDLNAKQR